MRRFLALMMILGGISLMFHPAVGLAVSHEMVKVITSDQVTNITKVKSGYQIVLSIKKIEVGSELQNVSQVVGDIRDDFSHAKSVPLSLVLENGNYIELQLQKVSALGEKYLKLEVKDSHGFLKKYSGQLNIVQAHIG